jgi:hypothetical protein
MKRLEFLAAIDKSCRDAEKTSGIPQGWFKAQAIQETGGYGLSDVAVHAHNLFGTKGSGTTAYRGYATFVDWDASIQYQGWQLNQHRYLPFKKLAQSGDFRSYGDAIQVAGYCRAVQPGEETYGAMIQRLAEDYDLLPPKPVVVTPIAQHSVAMQWCIDQSIIDLPATNRQVDLETLAWALFKAKGKI